MNLNVNVNDRSIINKCKTCLNFTSILMFDKEEVNKLKPGDVGKCEANMDYNCCKFNS